MDVTYTNVLQGVRQYFQGIPSSSNTSIRIPETPYRISPNAQTPSSDSNWPEHPNTRNRLESNTRHLNSTNPGNQIFRLPYNKEVEVAYPSYRYYNKNDGSQSQHLQVQQMPNISSHEQCTQQDLYTGKVHQHLQEMSPQTFNLQPKHYHQKYNEYLPPHSEESRSNICYPQNLPFQHARERMNSHYFPERSSVAHSQIENVPTYSSSPEQPTKCYPGEYDKLKKYSYGRTYFPEAVVNSDCIQSRIKPIENLPSEVNIYSENVFTNHNHSSKPSYRNTLQTFTSDAVTNDCDNFKRIHEPKYTFPMASNTNHMSRESIISSINNSRTRDATAQKTMVLSHLKTINSDKTILSKVQVRQPQPQLTENLQFSHQSQHRYPTTVTNTHMYNSDIKTVYITENHTGSTANPTEVCKTKPSGVFSSSHEQLNNYMHSYNTSNKSLIRKESPLDLSLRTVKTSADSTLNELDNDTKPPKNKKNALTLAKHYPQFDVEMFENNITQRSSMLPNLTTSHYDFRPSFSELNQSPKVKYLTKGKNRQFAVNKNDAFDKNTLVHNNQLSSQNTSIQSPNNRFASQINSRVSPCNANYFVEPQGIFPSRSAVSVIKNQSTNLNTKKRPSTDIGESDGCEKMPRLMDSWRKSIDMQIDEKLSTYIQQQKKNENESVNVSMSNNYQENENRTDSKLFFKKSCESTLHKLSSVIQESRHYSKPETHKAITCVGSNMSDNFKVQNKLVGADKCVLNKLRNSLELKGKRKMEQKANDLNFIERVEIKTVQSEKCMRNVPIDSMRNSNSHISKNGNSVITQTNSLVCTVRDTPEGNDHFSEYSSVKIKTKGELKQGGLPITGNTNQFDEKRQPDISNNSDLTLASEPEIHITNQNGAIKQQPPHKVEENVPNKYVIKNKSGFRSSSETSVFDFPDSDSENDDRESLKTMRKYRKPKQELVSDVKIEASADVADVNDDFATLCDDFVSQLKCGFKRKCKRGKTVDCEQMNEPECTLATETQLNNNQGKQINGCEEPLEFINQKSKSFEPRMSDDNETNNNKLPSNNSSNKMNLEIITCGDNDQRTFETESKLNEDSGEVLFEISNVSESNKLKSDCHTDREGIVSQTLDSNNILNDVNKSSLDAIKTISVIRPYKKPSFGDPSYFYPGWEEGVYKYKKSLRIPPTLIQISRPPQFHRTSTSLPDLDPHSQSPTVCSPHDSEITVKLNKTKSESFESDNESDSSFNIFGKKTNYDSESSTSIISSPNSTKELSILDKLLEKYGRNRERKYKRNEYRQRKLYESTKISTDTNGADVAQKNVNPSSNSKPKSDLKMNNFKQEIMTITHKNDNSNDSLSALIQKSKTRKECRIRKQRATIKEVFGEERPASAPPITFLNDLNFKKSVFDDDNCLGNLVIKIEKRDDMIDRIMQEQKINLEKQTEISSKVCENIETKTIITETVEKEFGNLDSNTLDKCSSEKLDHHLVDEYNNLIRVRKKYKTGKTRRKQGSSGFDYIRKKKKVKKEPVGDCLPSKKEKSSAIEKTPESINDICKEIKMWVLNKGIGETHLHRAARLGYTDVTAYCLEKLNCNPSPKDNAGYTPLHEACAKGHRDIVKLLLMYGANPSESAQGGVRPLHEACENGYVEITRLLLAYGADPTLVTYSGLTPLALTNDELTKNFLKNHLNDIEGEPSSPWISNGPSSLFDPVETSCYSLMENVPDADPELEDEDVQFEVADRILPNFYTLRNEMRTDRWILLQDLSNLLKIKSKEALIRQITHPSTTNYKTVFREMKMSEFMEQAQCCQFLNLGEKINSRASKIALVKYTKKLKELLNIETITITR